MDNTLPRSKQPYELRFTDLVYKTLVETKSTDDLVMTTLALICTFKQNAFLAAKQGDVTLQAEIAEIEQDIHDIVEPTLFVNKKGYKQMRIRKDSLDVQKIHDCYKYLWGR